MIVGVPRETKNNENRVAITPSGVHDLVQAGHKVLIEAKSGNGSGIGDSEYASAGADVLGDPQSVFALADLILKVKEPLESEYALLREGQALFTYLHLAPNPSLARALTERRVTGLAYETVEGPGGGLPILAPMSEVAGRMSVQVGAMMLQRSNGGRGILLGGVPGVMPGNVLIIGGGVVGLNAAKMAVGLGARVSVMDINKRRLEYLDDIFGGRVTTLVYSQYTVAEVLPVTDLLIGAVLIAGARAPRTVTEPMVATMRKGSVIVDVAIDQGGSIETIDRVTTHDNPCYEKHGVIHYSVANMPGAVPRTSTFALTSVTMPYVMALASKGIAEAMDTDPGLRKGLNTYQGRICHPAVAAALGSTV